MFLFSSNEVKRAIHKKMVEKKRNDSGTIGLQIDAPSRANSPRPSEASLDMSSARNLPKPLSLEEKKYLLAVERGDLANVRRMLQRAHRKKTFDINCVDSLGRGALTIAIDAENLEMVELLVIMSVETRDALLQAIDAEFVEAVELLLEHEELIHKDGDPYSWQKVDVNTSEHTPDITPLILAAHKNNYEILKILLDRGATVPTPHDIRCGCEECIRKSSEDSLRYSLSRVNEYRALASPSLIALSSVDPLLTAFKLSWELRNLAFAEQECKSDYLELRRQCQQFAVDLLDQSRSSQELAIVLNHDPDAPPYADGDHMSLARLELAIEFKQKKFVAHPNIQQLLATLWYDGVPGFRRKAAGEKMFIILRVVVFFPLYCLMYMIAPNCGSAKLMRKPFMKFLIHASSYLFFLLLLILVSQRAETHVILMFGTDEMKRYMEEQMRRQRGNGPSPLEYLVVLYVVGFIWEETQEILNEGIRSYLRNMWNFIDFSRNSLYCLTALLRTIAYIQQSAEISRDPSTMYIPREHWDDFDPQLIAEGLFAAANVFSAIKLVHLFSINPHLGPLQISLGRMVIDIVKFFFIYSLVLFAFACGLNQLLWYFADLERQKCYHKLDGTADWDGQSDACMRWRRFGNLFESSQSLFWASFGSLDIGTFELAGIKSYTRFWGLLMFGSYSVINVIVLLNLLIAMMSNSYAMIDQHSDTEWKFARTKLWMSYFEESGTLPPPFNILPCVKWITRFCRSKKTKEIKRGSTIRRREDREHRYTNVIRSLVWRYVSAMQRRVDDSAVTEDDINEVKSDISSMRYEMLEVFERNGMDISSADKKEKSHLAKRMKVWERRLMKDFHVAPTTTEECDEKPNEKGLARFRRVAHEVVNQTTSHKWNEAVQGVTDTQIGRCRNRESFRNQQNLAKAMTEAKRLVQHSPIQSRPCTPLEYNDPTTNTLLELLKNITEEIGEFQPSRPPSKQERENSVAQLHAIIGNKTPSPLPPNIIQLAESMAKIEDSKQRQSISSTLSQLSNDLNNLKARSRSGSVDLRGADAVIRSPSPVRQSSPMQSPIHSPQEAAPPPLPQSPPPTSAGSGPIVAPRSKSPEPKGRKSITSLGSSSAEPSPRSRSPSPTKAMPQPIPDIQITRTESNRSTLNEKWVKPKELEEDKMNSSDVSKPIPKVIKRRAPAPINDGPDISISRPVANIDRTKGMIPPPPLKLQMPSTSGEASIPDQFAPKTMQERPSSPRPVSPVTRKSPTPPPSKPLSTTIETINSSYAPQSLESINGSSESLVKSSEPSSQANQAAASPPSLRPGRKVTDVTTIRRQPKTGWL